MAAVQIDGEEADLYRGMFENAIWGIFQTTANGHYLAANPALAEIYGYPSRDAMLSALTDIGRQLYVDPRRRDDFVRMMARLSGSPKAAVKCAMWLASFSTSRAR